MAALARQVFDVGGAPRAPSLETHASGGAVIGRLAAADACTKTTA